MQKGYWSAQGHVAQNVLLGELKGAYFGFGDWVGLMLLGMALLQEWISAGPVEYEDVCVDRGDWAPDWLGWCLALGRGRRGRATLICSRRMIWMQAPV